MSLYSYELTAPVDAYKPNKFGFYNMVGNLWEWTNDWFSPEHPKGHLVDPKGPPTGTNKVRYHPCPSAYARVCVRL